MMKPNRYIVFGCKADRLLESKTNSIGDAHAWAIENSECGYKARIWDVWTGRFIG